MYPPSPHSVRPPPSPAPFRYLAFRGADINLEADNKLTPLCFALKRTATGLNDKELRNGVRSYYDAHDADDAAFAALDDAAAEEVAKAAVAAEDAAITASILNFILSGRAEPCGQEGGEGAATEAAAVAEGKAEGKAGAGGAAVEFSVTVTGTAWFWAMRCGGEVLERITARQSAVGGGGGDTGMPLDADGATAAHVAASSKKDEADLAILVELLDGENGAAMLSAVTTAGGGEGDTRTEGDTALMVAARDANLKAVKVILGKMKVFSAGDSEHANININAQNAKGDSAMHLAGRCGDEAVFKAIEAVDGVDATLENVRGKVAKYRAPMEMGGKGCVVA